MRPLRALLAATLSLTLAAAAQAGDVMRMAVTTSFANSGLADVLLPEVKKDLGLEVQLLIVAWVRTSSTRSFGCTLETAISLVLPGARPASFLALAMRVLISDRDIGASGLILRT